MTDPSLHYSDLFLFKHSHLKISLKNSCVQFWAFLFKFIKFFSKETCTDALWLFVDIFPVKLPLFSQNVHKKSLMGSALPLKTTSQNRDHQLCTGTARRNHSYRISNCRDHNWSLRKCPCHWKRQTGSRCDQPYRGKDWGYQWRTSEKSWKNQLRCLKCLALGVKIQRRTLTLPHWGRIPKRPQYLKVSW